MVSEFPAWAQPGSIVQDGDTTDWRVNECLLCGCADVDTDRLVRVELVSDPTQKNKFTLDQVSAS